MKVPVIDLEELAADINSWGVDTELNYDEAEEAYVLHAGEVITHGIHTGKRELSIAPGFSYRLEHQEPNIYAYTNQLYVHITDVNPVSSAMRSYIIARSRVDFNTKNKMRLVTISTFV